MFIRSRMTESVIYRNDKASIEIKPQTITYIDDALVAPEALLACYGPRIDIVPPELAEEILGINQVQAPLGEKDSTNGESNTGDKDVDDFLNGKTDVVPEGTEEITDEEAKKLAEEQAKEEAEENTKEPAEVKKTPAKKPAKAKATKSAKAKSNK